MPRMAEVLQAVNASVASAVRGVFHAPPAALAHALHSYGKGAAAHAAPAVVTPVSTVSASHASLVQEIQNFAYNWSPVVMILFFTALIFLMWRTLKTMPRVKPQQIKPASNQSVSFEDIAGVDEAKGELQEIVEFLRDPKPFMALGANVPKGILLHGPPGTGKTLLAKAVAHESGAQFFAQSAASFVEMFAGLGAARIRRLFAVARKHEPAIIFIDELDAVGGRRGMDISGEKDQTLNQLLVEMDGFSTSGRVVVIAASNLLEKLDPALLRPGRFDRQVFVVPPDVKGRLGVLPVHTRDKPLQDVDLMLVAQKTSEELLDYMTVLLGGRVAEQIVFGAITTGASDDLKRVADIAHSMVHDYAMGTAGVGRSPDGDVRLSETTLRIRDEERQDLIEEAGRAAQRMIRAHRPQLDALAEELLEHEVLDRAAIDRIMSGVPRLERAPGVGLRIVAARALEPEPPPRT